MRALLFCVLLGKLNSGLKLLTGIQMNGLRRKHAAQRFDACIETPEY